uniref:Uncharacterized protein n=1 Tax=Pithovirus LCPAC406 TaxID=2506599 RepID=A0A481ZD95_9VIRU|nr:MAG: hypothetical protein LCPAC406_01920 [Pithovirus LCPAC406]
MPFRDGRPYKEYDWIKLRYNTFLDSPGYAVVRDTTIKSVKGVVEFRQLLELTKEEIDSIMNGDRTCKEIVDEYQKANSLLITKVDRVHPDRRF